MIATIEEVVNQQEQQWTYADLLKEEWMVFQATFVQKQNPGSHDAWQIHVKAARNEQNLLLSSRQTPRGS